MRRLPIEKRAQIAHLLVKGMSMRAVEEVTGVDINTIMRLLLNLGKACEDYQDKTVVELKCARLELDEVWSYIHTKEEHLLPEERGTVDRGDSYTWIAIDPDTKLVPCWHVGKRTLTDAHLFIQNLASRMDGVVQISTDGYMPYKPAIEDGFGTEAHYAQLYKVFEKGLENMTASEFLNRQRYTQPELKATSKVVIFGNPDLERVSTSIIERHNRTVRMSVRRMTRAVDSFSKSFEHHKAALALMHGYYNFVRIHRTLRCTPAMEAGIANHVWTMKELVELEPAPVAIRPKFYKKRGDLAA